MLAALDAKGCPQIKQLCIAETGTFDHRCEAMSSALRAWAHDDRVDAPFRYPSARRTRSPSGSSARRCA